MHISLGQLLVTHRVVITVGCGGVGKTTVAAALALAAARRGQRVLCLTIDPAKRLATSLGLREMHAEAQEIPRAIWELPEGSQRPTREGSLTAMMLDVRGTFDELVARHASSTEVRDRIYANRIYREVSSSLAGTPEYMAMEKLYALKDDPRYDLIVLDTPPTSNALDFLDAPDRMIAAMDSPAIRAFVSAFESTGTLSLNLLSRAMAKIFQGLSRFTGAGFLDQVAQFLTDAQSLFGGFRERATRVREALTGSHVAFVIVTSPDPMAIGEATYFAERLQSGGLSAEALVINRVRTVDDMEVPMPERVASVLRDAQVEGAQELSVAFTRAWRDAITWARRDAVEVARARSALAAVPRHLIVPAFDQDVLDVEALSRVAALLV